MLTAFPSEGDTHLGGGIDTNSSTESFELVTEDNNGEGKAKTESRKTVYVQRCSEAETNPRSAVIPVSPLCPLFFFPAPSSEDEWVPLELCFGMPLFSSELNRKVCRKIASHKLCSSER